MNPSRPIRELIAPQFVMEGAGVLLRRAFGPHVSNRFDPFLLFDHFAFNDPVEGPIRGFPMHPHRGIETVTYMLEGSVNHRDSLGNAGLIGPGDVQWMTAGGGILHEEMPRRGPSGAIYGFQLWVNLPARLKMSAPRYQEVPAGSIPYAQIEGGRLRVVAGQAFGTDGPVSDIAAAPLYLEADLQPGASMRLPVPAGHTALAYLFEGAAGFGPDATPVEAVQLVVFADGESIEAQAGPDGARFLLMTGAPFGEPIFPYGPFVMNTREEIEQTIQDLRNGTFVR